MALISAFYTEPQHPPQDLYTLPGDLATTYSKLSSAVRHLQTHWKGNSDDGLSDVGAV